MVLVTLSAGKLNREAQVDMKRGLCGASMQISLTSHRRCERVARTRENKLSLLVRTR